VRSTSLDQICRRVFVALGDPLNRPMDYCGRAGFDKANLVNMWATAGRL
jgi:hypothetical protein